MTEVRTCLATTSPNLWPLGAGADKPSAVAPPDDELGSYINNGNIGDTQQFSLSASSIPPGSTINSVTILTRACGVVGGSYKHGLALGANTSKSGVIVNDGFLVWVDDSNALPRPGGGAWSQADMASLEVLLECIDNSHTTFLTTCTVTIDFSLPAPSTGAMLLMF